MKYDTQCAGTVILTHTDQVFYNGGTAVLRTARFDQCPHKASLFKGIVRPFSDKAGIFVALLPDFWA